MPSREDRGQDVATLLPLDPGRASGARTTTRILVVDDHAVVRAGISMLLGAEPGFDIVGESGTARDALVDVRSLLPDVILLDVAMPGQTGIEAIPQLLHEHPVMMIVVLSMEDGAGLVREAFAAGATGYGLKEAVGAELVAAIRTVAAGGHYVDPELGARLVTAVSVAPAAIGTDPLSTREREVLGLVTLGHTNREIAEQLVISVRTAEGHRAHIMQKLGLTTRAQLVRYELDRD